MTDRQRTELAKRNDQLRDELPPDVSEDEVFGAIVLGCRQSHQQSIDAARRVLMGVAHACPGSVLADALDAIRHHLGGEHLAGEVAEQETIAGPCTYCGSLDHWRPDCPLLASDLKLMG